MNNFIKYSVCILLLSQGHFLFSQAPTPSTELKSKQAVFTIQGTVNEKGSTAPISQVNVEVNGGQYTTTNASGVFEIQAQKGDELVIKHKGFETVYYSIQDDGAIRVELEQTQTYSKLIKKRSGQEQAPSFESLIDSATLNVKIDAEKSMQFITKALSQNISSKQNSVAYETLADVYSYWNQFDLAVDNYEISLQTNSTVSRKLKLANALRLNKNYQESLLGYSAIDESELSNYQKVEMYEGIGDVYKSINNYDEAVANYQQGLQIAQKHFITPKITDLNSKIAEVYAASGNFEQAQGFYSNSLDLAGKENSNRSLREKVKVADFQNKNKLYADEIELRKDALKDLENSLASEGTIMANSSALTSQQQNYKIGNAYVLQKNYNEAIPYLKKSISEADSEEDISVQKDATRKLSEVYSGIGDYNKALVTYQQYVKLVDKLYVKMEQDILQANRFNRDITNQQSRISSLETDRQLSQSIYELSREQNKRQKLIIYSLVGGLLLLLITAYFMYKYIKQQKLANNLLDLKSLRSQMNPHFIFNALNSVNSFIAMNDERAANKYLSDFSQLMRAVLENSEENFIPLAKEIELIELYTKLEHFRFKDAFDYTITVAENININEFHIPPMLLQPYIENAVWHGLRYKSKKGLLDIKITQKQPDEISITIIDDGIGRQQSKALKTAHQQKQTSKGMGNIKKRVRILNAMYKDKVTVFIEDYQQTEASGTKVVVTLKK
ncbi:histidine kinase [Flavobacteriaceae bacterium]|nr:histidine kinase [Flavobacteriaceae bacterium]